MTQGWCEATEAERSAMLAGDRGAVAAQLELGLRTSEEIAAATGLSHGRIANAIVGLCIDGLARRVVTGNVVAYQAVRP